MKVLLLSFSLLFSSSAAASFLESLFIPKARTLSLWDASNEANRNVIDHTVWQTLLGRYLDATHRSDGGDVPALHLGGEDRPLALATSATERRTRVPGRRLRPPTRPRS